MLAFLARMICEVQGTHTGCRPGFGESQEVSALLSSTAALLGPSALAGAAGALGGGLGRLDLARLGRAALLHFGLVPALHACLAEPFSLRMHLARISKADSFISSCPSPPSHDLDQSLAGKAIAPLCRRAAESKTATVDSGHDT